MGAPRVLWLYHPHERTWRKASRTTARITTSWTNARLPVVAAHIAGRGIEPAGPGGWVFAGNGACTTPKRPQAQGRIECILCGVDAGLCFPCSRGRLQRALRSDAFGRKFKFVAGMRQIDLRIDQPLIPPLGPRAARLGLVFIGP
jgi:hypothetical protein